MLLLVLLLVETDLILEKIHGKKNLVSLLYSSDSKVVFTLLTKAIALYMRLFAIHIQGINLQKFISRLLGDDKNLNI